MLECASPMRAVQAQHAAGAAGAAGTAAPHSQGHVPRSLPHAPEDMDALLLDQLQEEVRLPVHMTCLVCELLQMTS